ncbi:DUF5067 domain-containing protein [Apilactobacillus xinyiensis]|uniref:DUF5067 domain-containing protein n=1 Tax=Apilactobacillus xinyiensis TaxID=2841032 RepID=UPI00200F90EB|nr:DUF5067 domain-containing protein [Apilactobacillus xinyiensis]MCL0330634.1 DUF5067 domain-containing protein [Apilactobacillus xinyiensis]
MKKIAALSVTTLALLTLTACGSKSENKSNSTNVSVGKTDNYYFKNDVANIRDLKIKINKVKIIQAGQKGNDYGQKPVIAYWYSVTNKTNKEIDPNSAWMAVFQATQSDNNAEHTLDVTALPDSKYLDSQMDKIKKGGTVKNAVAYTLHDTKSAVKLTANKGIGGEKIGSQNYNLTK